MIELFSFDDVLSDMDYVSGDTSKVFNTSVSKVSGTSTLVVFVLKKVSLKQNKFHSRSLDLHLVFINEGLPE